MKKLIDRTRSFRIISWIIVNTLFYLSCTTKIPDKADLNHRDAEIYPDYTDIIIPSNIAPLNFRIESKGIDFIVEIAGVNEDKIVISNKKGIIQIPISEWKTLLRKNTGELIKIIVYKKNEKGKWEQFNPIINKVVPDNIDKYISYRKIPPANILWKEMGIFQRSLETFEESAIMVNKMSAENCMNCHSFNSGDPEQFMMHMRGKPGGTIIKDGNEIKFINTFSQHTRGAGAYPSWHPNGRYIAYSVNKVSQHFHSRIGKIVFVKDQYSDIVIYDRVENSIIRPALLASEMLENLPSWSPDGKYLYFVRAEEIIDSAWYEDIKYNLVRVNFNAESRSFEKDTVILNTRKAGVSLTYPRVSPDNRFISFILLNYGYFSVYSRESDVFLYSLANGKFKRIEGNSTEVESYPSWSNNGRWLMFISKREDGILSHVWFTYVDEYGNNSKPFILPQKDPGFYSNYIYNYNRPEFMQDKVRLSPKTVAQIIRSDPQEVGFDMLHSVSITSGATKTFKPLDGIYHQD